MQALYRQRWCLVVATLSLTLAACQSLRTGQEPTPSQVRQVASGERIELLLRDGTSITLLVIEVTDTHVKGREGALDVSVPIEAIAQARYPDASRDESSGGWVEGILAMIAASVALSSGDQDTVNRKSEYETGRNP